MGQGAEDRVFKALADPTRRAILDVLFDGDGQSVGALAARFPEMTRFGVMKHLRVLEEANLVVALARGRSTLHYLNAVPIAQIAHRWVSRYAAPFAGALISLDGQLSLDGQIALDHQTDPEQHATDLAATGSDPHPPTRPRS